MNKKILIIDDDLKFGRSVSFILKERGYIPFSIDKGREAIGKINETKPALVLLDLKLEDMSGVDLLRDIRKQFPLVEVVVFTGAFPEEVAVEAVTLGAFSYLLKPLNIDQLLILVQRALEKMDKTRILEIEKRKYMQLLELAQEGIWAIDSEENTTYVNPKMAEMLGYNPEEMAGKSLYHFMDEKGKEICRGNLERRKKGFKEEHEFEFLKKDGTRIYTSLSTGPIIDETGNYSGALAVISDITARKRADEDLKKEKETAQKYLDIAGSVIIVVDADEKVSLINKKGCSLLGYEDNEIIGKNWFDNFIPERIKDDLRSYFRELLECGIQTELIFENPVRNKHGEERIIAWNNSFLRDEEGNIVATISSGEDITDRKAAEGKLLMYSLHLQELVEERTLELKRVHESLLRKEKLAYLGQMAGSVGHELRNPLGVISNAVYFLDTAASESHKIQKEYYNIISQEVRKADKIISDLLDISRIKSLERTKVPVKALLTDALLHEPPPQNIKVTLSIEEEVCIFVDYQKMSQVLMNLIQNASQSMPKGGELLLKAGTEVSSIYISVSDTGCGISAENLDKIFEPLFTTKPRGIGLGLAVCRSLVEANEGSLEVESTEGKGTTFTIIFPVKTSEK